MHGMPVHEVRIVVGYVTVCDMCNVYVVCM